MSISKTEPLTPAQLVAAWVWEDIQIQYRYRRVEWWNVNIREILNNG